MRTLFWARKLFELCHISPRIRIYLSSCLHFNFKFYGRPQNKTGSLEGPIEIARKLEQAKIFERMMLFEFSRGNIKVFQNVRSHNNKNRIEKVREKILEFWRENISGLENVVGKW